MKAIEKIRAMKKAYEDEVQGVGKEALREAFSEFFDANPDINAIRWNQYTPYFNDGDACTFGVHDFAVRMGADMVPADGGDDDENEDGFEDAWDNKKLNAFARAVRDGDVFQAVFGDHVQVTATKDGFEVDEYEHD